MQFSPKNTTRYSSALRIYLHKKLLKGSSIKSILPKLKKIMLFETVKLQNETNVDVIDFADTLLSAAELKLIRKGLALKLEFYGEGFVKCDIKKVQTLLLKAVETTIKTSTPWIKTMLKDNNLIICFYGTVKTKEREFFQKTGAILFSAYPSNINYIFLQTKRTEYKGTKSVSIWEYLLDPLSSLNIMLCDYY